MEAMTNYFIIGADGREYGPASMEDLQRWIGERRANARTKIRREGEAGWTTLGAVPELAELLGEAGGPASSSETGPPPLVGPGEELAEAVFRREPVLNIGDCFSRGWNLLVEHPGLLIGSTALVALLIFGVGSVPAVGVAVSMAFLFVLLGGLNLVFLRHLRGQSADIGIVFAGFSGALLVPLLLAGVIASALSFVGLMLCLVPGVYLIVCWGMYAPLLIIDRRLDFWQALECSRRVVTRYWWPHFGLFLLAFLVVCAGVLACGVGVIVALPLAIAAVVVAYEDTFSEPGEEAATTAWPLPAPDPSPVEPEASVPQDDSGEQKDEPSVEVKPDLATPTSMPVANETKETSPPSAPGLVSSRPRSKSQASPARGSTARTSGKPKRVRKPASAPRRPSRSSESPGA